MPKAKKKQLSEALNSLGLPWCCLSSHTVCVSDHRLKSARQSAADSPETEVRLASANKRPTGEGLRSVCVCVCVCVRVRVRVRVCACVFLWEMWRRRDG